ncbi:hypothetical protein [Rhodococcus phenolicus]|uniref:hypothetical protein n=1 Tax=Rhodococcus phenolicus TaxID=263849 RepID=UPI00082CE0E2|nr:hypothetical protein [Rhodococcus phenolicus]
MPGSSPSTRQSAPRRWERLATVGLAGVVAVVTLLVLFAPEAANPEPGAADPQRDELQSLLDTWAAAVRSADPDTLRTVLDEQARPGLLDAELRRADALSRVPLADWGYELSPDPAAPVAPGIAARLGSAEAQTRSVYLRYAIDGIDPGPTRKPVTVVVVRRDDGWHLVDDEPGPGRDTWRGPWDFGPLVVEPVDRPAGTRSLVIGHPEQKDLIDAIAREMESAVDAVDQVWGEDWSRRGLVLVTASHDEFTQQVGDRHNGDGIAAVAVSDAVDPRAGSVTGQRIVFSPAAGDRLTDDGLRTVLRHELTHVAARAHTVDGSPLWMLEGYADYIGYRGTDQDLRRTAPTLADTVSRDGTPAALPDDAEFTGERSLLAYETAWSLAAYTADDYGPARLTELYRRLARGPIEGAGLDAALGDVLGTDTGTFVAAWGSWVDARLAVPAR